MKETSCGKSDNKSDEKFGELDDNSDKKLEKVTKFAGLDKVLAGRQFLQILEVEMEEGEDKELRYDREWLAIIKSTHPLINLTENDSILPFSFPKGGGEEEEGGAMRRSYRPTLTELSFIDQILEKKGGSKIEFDFVKTEPSPIEFLESGDIQSVLSKYSQFKTKLHPQTEKFLKFLEIDSPSPALFGEYWMLPSPSSSPSHPSSNKNPQEMDLQNDSPKSNKNPEEIDLDDL